MDSFMLEPLTNTWIIYKLSTFLNKLRFPFVYADPYNRETFLLDYRGTFGKHMVPAAYITNLPQNARLYKSGELLNSGYK